MFGLYDNDGDASTDDSSAPTITTEANDHDAGTDDHSIGKLHLDRSDDKCDQTQCVLVSHPFYTMGKW